MVIGVAQPRLLAHPSTLFGGVFLQFSVLLFLTSSAGLSMASWFGLLLSFGDTSSLADGICGGAGIVWVGNEGIAVIAEIRVIRGSSGVLHLLPIEKFSVAGGGLAFAGSAFSGNCPGVRVVVAPVVVTGGRVAVVGWSVKPHRWRV